MDFHITSATRNKIKPLESRILAGLEPTESIIYDLQKNLDGSYFAYSWVGRKPLSGVDPDKYEYCGKVIHSSINIKEVYEIYKRKT